MSLGGLAMLVVLSQPPWFLGRQGFFWFAEFARYLDMSQMVVYVGLPW